MTTPRPPADGAYEARLDAIAAAVHGSRVLGEAAVVVRGVRHDSRLLSQGDLFVARRGEHSDGLAFVSDAIARGAAAVMAQRDHAPQSCSIPVLLVPDIRTAIGQAATVVYGDPTRELCVVGITGTNGKTTTSFLAQAALNRLGKRAGVLGTLGAHFEGLDLGSVHTTPEADEVVRLAARFKHAGASHLVMEVSSHALAQARADAVRFGVAALTNLTRDHLDFHGTMQAYAQAKSRLLLDLAPEAAAINVDDPFGATIAQRVRCPLVRVSQQHGSAADVHPDSEVLHDALGIRCDVTTPGGKARLESELVGEHNLSNLLLALGICVALGLDARQAAQALSGRVVVPGRLERCDGQDDDVIVLVDYAHTPDALQRALLAIRSLTRQRVHCVFGCGGDRDRSKRPLMGEIAGRLADVAIVTNDNPRTELPESIVDAILSGMQGAAASVVVEPERERAIELAITGAGGGDVVLIAGKGHESNQIVGATTRHFDDREQAARALSVRRAARGGRC